MIHCILFTSNSFSLQIFPPVSFIMRKRDFWKVPVFFGCLVGLVIANIFCSTRRTPEQLERKRRRERSDSPKPLPARRRALTLPLESLGADSSQQQSLFLTKLHLDVRYLIYQHVLRAPDHAYLHVASTHQRVCSFPCRESYRELYGWQHECWWNVADDGTTIPSAPINGPRKDVVSGLLCSCKKAYDCCLAICLKKKKLYVDQSSNLCIGIQKRLVSSIPATP